MAWGGGIQILCLFLDTGNLELKNNWGSSKEMETVFGGGWGDRVEKDTEEMAC